MIRPIKLKGDNEFSAIVFKNRREELAEIPVEYIKNISYDINTFDTMTIEIPSKISYKGKIIDYDLYEQIRGKMTIVVTLNSEKSKFIIDEDIDEVVEANVSKKTLKAYSYEKTHEKKSFIISEGATRQLYRPENETVEISDGILNWFEQQTNWTVGNVDLKARKELGLYNVTVDTVLFETFDKEKMVVDEVFWSKDVDVEVVDNAINMTISYPNMETYKDGQLQKRENINHTFNNLPYAIKHISCKYTSDSDYRYGLTYDITYKNDTKQSYKFGFAYVTDMRVIANNIGLSYQTGELEEKWMTKYRYFEQCSTNWWGFLLNDVAQAFDCVFVFDSYNQIVHAYDKNDYGENNGLQLNWDNAIKSINKKHKVGEVVSRLYVESPNCSIAEDNPLGGEFVESYEYYINSGIMSDELTNALKTYDILLEEKQIEFLSTKLEKNKIDQKITKVDSELKSLQERYKVENAILTAYIKSDNSPDELKKQSELVAQIDNEIQEKMKELQYLKDESTKLSEVMIQIGRDINKNNAKYNGVKIFTDEDLEELDDYTVEGSIQNDYYTIGYSLYMHALEKIADMNSVYIDFSLSTYDFLDKIKHPLGWQHLISIGQRIELEDKDILDKDGYVQLYAFDYTPSTNTVNNLKFTNNKKPVSAIKTIGDMGRKTSQQTTMTNFWKDTWKESAQNNVAVSDILQNGLDVASQIVRGKGTVNKIDISESGIYVIDSQDENKQIYIGSGLISLTQNRWQTSELAIDSSGVMGNTIVGKLLLGEKLQIGNEDNTFTITPDGLRIYDQKSSKEERIFIGIETVNGVKQARLRLHSANDSSKLVLSEQGVYQQVSIGNMRENLDNLNPATMSFFISKNFQRLDEAQLRLRIKRFRAYSKGASQQAQTVASATVSTVGGYSRTTSSGGGSYGNNTSTSSKSFASIDTFPTTPIGNGNHHHRISTTALTHTHSVSFSVPAHSHNVDISGHSHSSNVTIPSHTHNLVHGIYEYSQVCNVRLYVDDLLVMDNINGDRDINILPYLKYSHGWHTIKIVAITNGNNQNGLVRAEIDGHIGGFCSF